VHQPLHSRAPHLPPRSPLLHLPSLTLSHKATQPAQPQCYVWHASPVSWVSLKLQLYSVKPRCDSCILWCDVCSSCKSVTISTKSHACMSAAGPASCLMICMFNHQCLSGAFSWCSNNSALDSTEAWEASDHAGTSHIQTP